MPKMLRVGPNPQYKLPADATPEHKAAWDVIKRSRVRELPYVTAMENVRLSSGMYVPLSDEPEPTTPGPRRLEDYTMDELKVMMLNVGIKTEKQMKRSDVIAMIRKKLDEVDIADDAA